MAVPFFNDGTESIFVADVGGADNRFGVQKHPVVTMAIAIGLTVQNGMDGDRTG